MQDYIRKQMKTLEALTTDADSPDYSALEVGDDLRQIIRDVELRATSEGLPEVVEACQLRDGAIGVRLARLILSRCLAMVKEETPTDWLLVSEVADLLRVSESKVRDWIASGRLQAKNVSDGNRPSYRIHVENIQQLDDTTPEAKPRRRTSSSTKDYFSDD
jgi:excisionase family DNA binding protein